MSDEKNKLYGELAKLAGDLNVPGKIMDFLGKLVNPAAEEVSLILADRVRMWRFQNQLNILDKTREKLKTRGLDPAKVKMSILIPLLDEASLEEDDNMQDEWAQLLSEYADPANNFREQKIFISILKELSYTEIQFIETAFKQNGAMSISSRNTMGKLPDPYGNVHPEKVYYDLYINNLVRTGILERAESATRFDGADPGLYDITTLGVTFMDKLRPGLIEAYPEPPQ